MREDKEVNPNSPRQLGGAMLAGVIFVLLFLGPTLLKDLNPKTVPFTAIVWGSIAIIVVFKMMRR